MDSPESSTLTERLQAIVGTQNVIVERSAVELETRTCIPFRKIPDYLVYPDQAEQVRQIVTLAQELKVNVFPVSTGKNWGYGDATPPGHPMRASR